MIDLDVYSSIDTKTLLLVVSRIILERKMNLFRKLTLNEVSLNLKFDLSLTIDKLSMLGIYDTENDEIKSI
jgi:hypothetical protein